MFIPTENRSRIYKNSLEKLYFGWYTTRDLCQNQQLLILSDEEIKEGDLIVIPKTEWVGYCQVRSGDYIYGSQSLTKNISNISVDSYICKKIIASYPNIEGTLPIEDKDVEYMVNNVDCEVEIEEEQFFDICPDIDDVRSNKRPKLTNGFITLKFKEKEVEEDVYKVELEQSVIDKILRSGKISFNGTVFYRLDMVVKAVEKNYIPKKEVEEKKYNNF